ncbi:hypothetical protein NL676_032963 [Syzygium grande]|nr:hypothetical protein NL676_032963 [Syzygium grande]
MICPRHIAIIGDVPGVEAGDNSYYRMVTAALQLVPSGKLYFIDFEYGSYTYRGFAIGNHFNEYAGYGCDCSLHYLMPDKPQEGTMDSSGLVDVNPRISDDVDKIKSWKIPDVADPSQLKAVQLPDSVSTGKEYQVAVRFIYTNSVTSKSLSCEVLLWNALAISDNGSLSKLESFQTQMEVIQLVTLMVECRLPERYSMVEVLKLRRCSPRPQESPIGIFSSRSPAIVAFVVMKAKQDELKRWPELINGIKSMP